MIFWYCAISVVVYMLFLYLTGKYNYKFKFYQDKDEKLTLIIIGFVFSALWVLTIPIAILYGGFIGMIIVSVKILQYFDK